MFIFSGSSLYLLLGSGNNIQLLQPGENSTVYLVATDLERVRPIGYDSRLGRVRRTSKGNYSNLKYSACEYHSSHA